MSFTHCYVCSYQRVLKLHLCLIQSHTQEIVTPVGCVTEMTIKTLSKPDTHFISWKKPRRTETHINQIQSVTITGEREVKTHIHIDKLLLDACLLLLAVRKRPLLRLCGSRLL